MRNGQGADSLQYTGPGLDLIGLMQIVTLALHLAFVHEADRAMNKGGFGDYQRWAYWNGWAGIAFWALCGLWMAGILCAIGIDRRRRFPEGGLVVFIVYVLALPLAYLAAFIAFLWAL